MAPGTRQLEALQRQEAELRAAVERKKKEVEEYVAERTEYINSLTRGLLMYKHFGLDFESEWDSRGWRCAGCRTNWCMALGRCVSTTWRRVSHT